MTRRHLRAAALAAASLLAASRLPAQEGGAFAGHTYQPGIDVLDYDITLDLPEEPAEPAPPDAP